MTINMFGTHIASGPQEIQVCLQEYPTLCTMHLTCRAQRTFEWTVPLNEDISACKDRCKFLTSAPCDEDVFDWCTITMGQLGQAFPANRTAALELYLSLRDNIRTQMSE